MMRLQIVPFDVDTASRETWAAYHAYRRMIAAELHPHVPVMTDADSVDHMRKGYALWHSKRWLAVDGQAIIGFAETMFRRAGTPDAADYAPHLYGSGSVAAAARRKGVGTRLLQQIHGLMHALDKPVLTMEAKTDGAHAFMSRLGAGAKRSTIESRLLIEELDWSSLRTWEDAAGDLGLVFECYAGRVPREVLLRLLPSCCG
jgi:hypothetical protein